MHKLSRPTYKYLFNIQFLSTVCPFRGSLFTTTGQVVKGGETSLKYNFGTAYRLDSVNQIPAAH